MRFVVEVFRLPLVLEVLWLQEVSYRTNRTDGFDRCHRIRKYRTYGSCRADGL